ncbi:MAG: tRNA (guanosine(46)-N7)-methyltransferase TrmB [Proteobacteria bacterium]|nr:tRNA (guanosine(46)-N7)-methyltransferase TrmB [Pseudomonadota bacterium]
MECDSRKGGNPGVFLRTIRSFVKREGRLTVGQDRALEKDWPIYGLTLDQGQLDFNKTFGRNAPVIVEIGFGMGQSLVQMAQDHPSQDYIGIEVHRPGVGSLLLTMREQNVDNIRVYQEDAIEVLKQSIPDQSLGGVQLFFPDPWPKKKHHKRRIVQAEFIELIARKLVPNGWFHLATDWQPYADYMMEVLGAAHYFANRYGQDQFAPRPESRPVTKFERRGEKLGHGVWDLLFDRIDNSANAC